MDESHAAQWQQGQPGIQSSNTGAGQSGHNSWNAPSVVVCNATKAVILLSMCGVCDERVLLASVQKHKSSHKHAEATDSK